MTSIEHQAINEQTWTMQINLKTPSLRPWSTSGLKRPTTRGSSASISGSRPLTSLGFSNRPSCERVQQVEHESTRRHNLKPHLPVQKVTGAPWQKKFDGKPVQMVVAPGYILSRSKSKTYMYIKTDEFFDEGPAHHPSQGPNPDRDCVITKLQQQLDQLTVALEEEKMNHKETKKKANENLYETVEKLAKDHSDYVKKLMTNHKEERESIMAAHKKEVTDQANISEAHMAKIKGEVEFLQGAFDVYKTHLQFEQEERWKAREEYLRLSLAEEAEKQIHELKTKLISEKNHEKMELQREHQKKIAQLKREHQKELENTVERFSNVADDLEKLKETTKMLAKAEEELVDLKQEYEDARTQITSLTNTLMDTRVSLIGYEQNFQEKVQEVEDKYRLKIHDFMQQNTELRRLYMKKCEELYDEKIHLDQSRIDQLSSAKETMRTIISTRNNALINLVAMDAEWDEKPRQPKERPCSAPTTQGEVKTTLLSAGEISNNLEG